MEKCIFFLFAMIFANLAISQTSTTANVHEQRIERVIQGLLPQTATDNVFSDKKSLSDRMSYYQAAGVSIAVINDGKIAWARGFGVVEHGKKSTVTEKTLFQAASISKAIFSIAVMKLIEQKKMSLDEPVDQYLTSWSIPKVGEWQPRVTLRQILSHSAGLSQSSFPGYSADQKLPSVVNILNGQLPANTLPVVVNIVPGLQMRYSGGGTTVAQLAVTDVVKRPFNDLMNELVFKPLRLTNSTYEQPLPKSWQERAATGHTENNRAIVGKGHIYPELAAAGMWTTPSDLAQIGIELQHALKGRSRRLLSQASITEMIAPSINDNMGIGFFRQGTKEHVRFLHTGANEGFRADAIFYRDLGIGAVIMMNSNAGDLLFEIERAIAKEYAWPGYFIEPKKAVTIAPKALDRLTGTYVTERNVVFTVVHENHSLMLTSEAFGSIPLSPTSDGDFFVPSLNSVIKFGKKEMTISQSGVDTVAHKKKHHKKK